MYRRSRLIASATVVPVALALLAGGAGAKTHASSRSDGGKAYFSIVHVAGGIEFGAGTLQDKALGSGAVIYSVKAGTNPNGTLKVTVNKITLYTGDGSLTGTGSATVVTSGNTQKITNGKFDLTKGKGSLKGDQYVATFSGTADLSKNLLQYTYTGTLSH
jgi:hypothetical protein